jgi:hypothetical protein
VGTPERAGEENLAQELRVLVPDVVIQDLERWVRRQALDFVRPLRTALDSMSRSMPEIKQPSDAQDPLPIGPVFAACHPSRFRQEMEDALVAEAIWRTYQETLDLFVESTPEGRLFERYRLPRPVLMEVVNQGVGALADIQTSLLHYSQKLEENAQQLKGLRGDRGIKTGLKVGASIVGGLLLGPLGARAASFIAGEATSNHEEVYKLLLEVRDRFSALILAAKRQCKLLEQGLSRVLMDVYGGLVVRVAEDLRTADRSVFHIGFDHGLLFAHLSAERMCQVREHAEGLRRAIWASAEAEEWSDVAEQSHAAVEWLLAVPARSWVLPDEPHRISSEAIRLSSSAEGGTSEGGVCYTVLFGRWRALALRNLGDAAWNAGDFERAAKLYSFLVTASPVACGTDGSKELSTFGIGIAGWRLALVTSWIADAYVSNALVQHVVQAEARRQVPGLWLPGEGISRTTWVLADWIWQYRSEASNELDDEAAVPPPLQKDAQLWRTWSHRTRVGALEVGRTMWKLRQPGHSASPPGALRAWSRKKVFSAVCGMLAIVVLIPGLVCAAIIADHHKPHLDETAARSEERPFEVVQAGPSTDILADHGVVMTDVPSAVTAQGVSSVLQFSNVEVPSALYAEVMKRMGWTAYSQDDQGRHPAVQVSWEDAIRFCNGLSAIEGFDLAYRVVRLREKLPRVGWFNRPESPGTWGKWKIELVDGTNGFRLPTVDEWINAARGGTNDRWAGTDRAWRVCKYANVASRGDKDADGAHLDAARFKCRDRVAGLAEVGSFQPNAFGLFDMTGNAAEWTQSMGSVDGSTDGLTWSVVGSDFSSGPSVSLRLRLMRSLGPSEKDGTIGFRVVRSGGSSER